MPASRYIQRELVYTPGRTAVVIGGTGATGSKVLDILLARGEWEKVVVVGRREVPQQHEKLVQVVTELDLASLEKTKEHWVGATNVFNCIGTTRKQAKSAANFVAIEVGITEATAKIAKEAGVLHYSVVSAQGASTKVPAISWFQPMLYTNTLGRKQQAVIEKNFPRTTVFQPGMLDRMQRAEGEGVAGILAKFGFKGLKVRNLAEAMVGDAESTPVNPDAVERVVTYKGNNAIRMLAAEVREFFTFHK